MINERLERQIGFLVEIDKLKQVFRQSRIMDDTRFENDAEHSWHFAMLTLILAEYSAEPIDVGRVIKMALIHDIVEIDAGDSFVYDAAAMASKSEREQRAADRLFLLLPPDQAAEVRALWEEFEAAQSPEARFAGAIDRLVALLCNFQTQGGGWKRHDIDAAQVRARNGSIEAGAPVLWEFAARCIADAVAQGWIREGEKS